MAKSAATIILFSVIAIGCNRAIDIKDIQGEWVSDNAMFYLNIRGDSLLSFGYPKPIIRPIPTGTRLIRYSDLGPSPDIFVRHPRQFDRFHMGASGEVIISRANLRLDTIGILFRGHDTLFIEGRSEDIPVCLVPLHADTSIHVKMIQFSTTPCFGDCPVYDMELRDGSVVVTEPRDGAGRGHRSRGKCFVAPFSTESFAYCQKVVQKAKIRESKRLFEKDVEVGNDWPAYGLTVYFNDSVLSVLADAFHFPPELSPLLPYFVDPTNEFSLSPIDTTILFQSRLRILTSLNDSLTYLEGVDHARFRAARYFGGEEALQSYIRQSLGPNTKAHGTFCFNIVIGQDGLVEDIIDEKHYGLGNLFPLFQRILKASPRWQIPMYDSKPIRVTEFFCFYNEGP